MSTQRISGQTEILYNSSRVPERPRQPAG